MTRPALRGLPRLYEPDPATEDTDPGVGSRIRSFFDSVLAEIEAEESEEDDDVPTRRYYRHGV